jgi:hypothetical protein
MGYRLSQANYRIIADNFGPPELHIGIAEVNVLKAVGSLSVLGAQLSNMSLHPDFAFDHKLRQAFEDPDDPTAPTRFGGPLEFAIQAMCDRNKVDRAALDDFISASDSFVGPLLYKDPRDNDGFMFLTHEVSVYLVGG